MKLMPLDYIILGCIFELVCMLLLLIRRQWPRIRSIAQNENNVRYERTLHKGLPRYAQKNIHKTFAVRMHLAVGGVAEWFIVMKDMKDAWWTWQGRAYIIDEEAAIPNTSLALREFTYHERISLPLKESPVLQDVRMSKTCRKHTAYNENCDDCAHDKDVNTQFTEMRRNISPEALCGTVGGAVTRAVFQLTHRLEKLVMGCVVICGILLVAHIAEIIVIIWKVTGK